MIEALRSLFPAVALESVESIDQQTIRVPAANLVEICRALHDRPELGFVLLADITAVDWWPREPRYDVVYHLSSLTQRLRVKVSIDGNAPRLPTVQSVWPAAGWLERETWDMFGIVFEEHGDLRRLLMPDEWEGHPLRKDFPVQIRLRPRAEEPLQVTEEEFRANLAQRQSRSRGRAREARSVMADERVALVEAMLRDAARLHDRLAVEAGASVIAAADAMLDAFGRGAKVLIFGNGGSAADAQHFACELVGRFLRNRRALPAIALTPDTTTLTAIANDYGFDQVFVRQLEALGRQGDVAVAISTSGASANVLAGLQYARSRGLKTVAFTGGSGGPVGAAADVHVNVPHDVTPRVQELHRTLIHAVCDVIEQQIDRHG